MVPRGLKFKVPILWLINFLSIHQLNFYNRVSNISLWAHKSCCPLFHWVQPWVYNGTIGDMVFFMLFFYLNNNLLVPFILLRTKKQCTMPHNLIGIFKKDTSELYVPLFPPPSLRYVILRGFGFPLFSPFTILEWFSSWDFK